MQVFTEPNRGSFQRRRAIHFAIPHVAGGQPSCKFLSCRRRGIVQRRLLLASSVPRRRKLPPYSSRNTLIGSTRDARRAGIQHAASAIAVSSAATSANVTGSVAVTP